MKNFLFLSSVALVFSACVNTVGEYSIPEKPQPTQNQSLTDYLNNYQYPDQCFRKGPHAYCIKNPIKTIYSKDNEVLIQYDNFILNDQSLNLYHNVYEYCQAIGGKSIIKKEAYQAMLKHQPTLFNLDNKQVEEFVRIKDNYSAYEIPNGFFECQADDKSFEITHAFSGYSYEDDSDRFIGMHLTDVIGLFVIKFKTPQNLPFVGRSNYYDRDKVDEITRVKINAEKKENYDDRYFYHRILPLYHICKTRYNGTPYIIGDTTDNRAMHLGDYLLKSTKYGKGIGERGDYVISCINDTTPFTFKKTFGGKLEQRVASGDYNYRRPAAYYEVIGEASDLKKLEVPFEQRSLVNKLILKAYPNNYASSSSMLHQYQAFILRTPNHSNGYIGIVTHDKAKKIDNAIHTYKIEDNQKHYIGKVDEKEIKKAKEVVASNSDNIIKNCMLKLDNFKIGNYTIYCKDSVVYVKQGDKLHYIKDTNKEKRQ